ncbi:redoxin domain protein [Pseudoalteromonas sp. NBT06-2]|uniref:TlpA family protein disulfide reductase n=1 Tax=Pseudoalteromonas sp. NBT06-2 TaxID=2025950 RepID=UPI000BA56E7B|nr:TlpA disulfide reductase family protein [Pseudoalteromonas sp. NBT06-2]PAJ73752.1 redoxin domain protein [Pseudoalteromonas sp. NBT06-2]
MKTVLTIYLIAFLMGCSSTGNGNQPVKEKYQTYISAGQNFPIEKLIDINGSEIHLNKINKKKLVLLFATWCHDSQRTIKDILASDLVKDHNLIIIGIGREESNESLAKFKNEYQVSFPLISDPNKDIYKQFANIGVPRLLLLDENNKLVKALIGEDQRTIDRIIW